MNHRRNRILVFDVNETLLDIEVLNPFFSRAFGDLRVMRQWFTETILYSQALSLTVEYLSFDALSVAVLRMLAHALHISLNERDIDEFSQLLCSTPPHPEVPEALERLAEAAFTMVTLTNSGSQASKALLDRGKITRHFDRLFSVKEVRRYKPSQETYSLVANELHVEPARLRLVAAHSWDTLGALAAGYAAALITRPGNSPFPVGDQPDIIAPNLLAAAIRIIAEDD
jgi:2-haloacid dehalogenase